MKKMITLLALSVGANVLLMGGYFYNRWDISSGGHHFHYKPYIPGLALETNSNAEMIRKLRGLKLEQLVPLLSSRQLVENGYTERDLALASLIAFYDFDLARAIGVDTTFMQQRGVVYGVNSKGEAVSLTVYPGLTDTHFEGICRFASTERWPLTPAGIFKKIKSEDEPDPSLLEAFYLTPHFTVIKRLFSYSGIQLDRLRLIKILKEGDWSMIVSFVKEQRELQNLSPQKRQQWLYQYAAAGSTTAAQLLLETDGAYVIKKFEDEKIVQLLERLGEKSTFSEQFVRSLLTSPRSDAVWSKASELLYKYAGETPPEQQLHHAAIGRFITETKPAVKPVKVPVEAPKAAVATKPPTAEKAAAVTKPPVAEKVVVVGKPVSRPEESAKPKVAAKSKKQKYYLVQDGDSLWKIAKRFNMSVEVIRDLNNLESDALVPGMQIRLSYGSGEEHRP